MYFLKIYALFLEDLISTNKLERFLFQKSFSNDLELSLRLENHLFEHHILHFILSSKSNYLILTQYSNHTLKRFFRKLGRNGDLTISNKSHER